MDKGIFTFSETHRTFHLGPHGPLSGDVAGSVLNQMVTILMISGHTIPTRDSRPSSQKYRVLCLVPIHGGKYIATAGTMIYLDGKGS